MSITRGTAIPTIDAALVVITTEETTPTSIAIDTSNKVEVSPEVETTAAVRCMVKGTCRAQKRQSDELVGHTIKLTDCVFTPEVAAILVGGSVTTDSESGEVTGYTPPVIGATTKGKLCTIEIYSAQMDSGGDITNYEKTSYPHCMGSPIDKNIEDGVFKVDEYSIYSLPTAGEAPYDIDYVATLPAIAS